MLGQEHADNGISACNNYVAHAKGGGVFEAVGNARAIYVVKRDECCVLRLGCLAVDIYCKFLSNKIIISNIICGAPKRETMNGILCSCVRLQYVIIRCLLLNRIIL